MKKSEIIKEIVSVVCDCAEVEECDVRSANRMEDVVMARCAVIGLCKEYGITNKMMQEFLNLRSHGSISYHLTQFGFISRNDRPFKYLLSCVRHELDKTLPIDGQ